MLMAAYSLGAVLVSCGAGRYATVVLRLWEPHKQPDAYRPEYLRARQLRIVARRDVGAGRSRSRLTQCGSR